MRYFYQYTSQQSIEVCKATFKIIAGDESRNAGNYPRLVAIDNDTGKETLYDVSAKTRR